MRIVIINPNSTTSMTDAMVQAAQAAEPGLRFEGWTSHDGPPAIQGEADGTVATPPLLKLVQKASDDGADGIIIGCFDDTGLRDAARLAKCPVIGIGQASYHYAALRNWRFSVVTTLGISVPVIEENIRMSGLSVSLSKVRASDVAVLELDSNTTRASALVLEEAKQAVRDDNIDCIILGCAGMTQVTQAVRAAIETPVVDSVTAAAQCVAWISKTH